MMFAGGVRMNFGSRLGAVVLGVALVLGVGVFLALGFVLLLALVAAALLLGIGGALLHRLAGRRPIRPDELRPRHDLDPMLEVKPPPLPADESK